jgi:hypothetical protein
MRDSTGHKRRVPIKENHYFKFFEDLLHFLLCHIPQLLDLLSSFLLQIGVFHQILNFRILSLTNAIGDRQNILSKEFCQGKFFTKKCFRTNFNNSFLQLKEVSNSFVSVSSKMDANELIQIIDKNSPRGTWTCISMELVQDEGQSCLLLGRGPHLFPLLQIGDPQAQSVCDLEWLQWIRTPIRTRQFFSFCKVSEKFEKNWPIPSSKKSTTSALTPSTFPVKVRLIQNPLRDLGGIVWFEKGL